MIKNQKEIIKELENFWNIKEFVFEAQYAINKKGNGFFRNLRKKEDKSKVFLPNGNQLTVGAPNDLTFEEGKNYIINIFVPNDKILEKFENEYTIFLDTKKYPPITIETQPEIYVKSLENEYKSVIGIGLDSLKGAIKRISTDINRKPETFIFELLQNADDYPDKNKGRVAVSFKIIDDHLVFQHNGLPFSANNVRALCSVDAGDKEFDFEKIGYKGIGFKSIFKHSNYVVIHSGGYTFRFDENHHRAKGIDTFWQLIPIWTELSELPTSVQSQINETSSVTVIIKPEEGNNQLKSYEETFNTIFKDERVLLFLRWVEHFSFIGENSKIVRRKDSNTWAISKLDAVVVTEELRKLMNDRIKVDDRIPQKYEDIDKTIITFATQKKNGKIVPTEQAHLYAYLPTDLDFGFPFLLNGDFIPDGGRHYLHADLEWNQFLFTQAGKELLKWIAAIWNETTDYGAIDMLPDEKILISERPDDEKAVLLHCFMKGLSEEQLTTSFIPDASSKLNNVSDIIIDATGLFSKNILNNELFYSITKTKKKLPNSKINLTRLFSKYLDIEKFSSNQLIIIFKDEANKLLLKQYIQKVDFRNYINFLKWLNKFIGLNGVTSSWLLTLPIIRVNSDTINIQSALLNNSYLFKTVKTKSIELILAKAGFNLSEFYLDDKYENIYNTILTENSYLKTDLKLYEHIAEAKGLGKLTAEEKNALLTFLEGLDEVGKAKYAKSLALFKSKKMGGVLNPLNSLISNTFVNIPMWLSNFVIDQKEENALSEVFKKNLLKREDVLEKVFCNLATFNDIITGINTENIEDFYTYILKLYKEKPEESKIDFSQIPWVFIPSSNSFVLPTTVYWPDSMAKLSAESYASVKAAIETLSIEVLPHYAAMQLKVPFGLGSKAVNISTTFSKTGTFDVLPINHFLDWLQSEGERTFFTKFSIIKTAEQYTIAPSAIVQYYTDNQDLVTFIESSSLNTKLALLPSEVYAEDRKKIGLLEGTDLLKYGLENGMAIPSFAKFIYKANDAELSLHYLSLLENVNIDTTKTYNSESDEFKIIKLAVLNIVADEEKLKSFRGKITIDDIPLLEKAISDDIYFKKSKINIKTKLSDVIKAYKDNTFSVNSILKCFEQLNDKKDLITLFKSDHKPVEKLFKELSELNLTYYNPVQTFFLSFYKSQYPEVDVFKDKILFTVNKETNAELFEKEIKEFLDICLDENNFTQFIEHKIIPDFIPTNYILNEKYAIESEKPPLWLSDWLNASDNKNKLAYLNQLRINDDSYPVVLFRKAIIESLLEEINLNRESIDNNFLLTNTLTWLSEQQTKDNLVLKKEVLQPLYTKLQNRKIPVIGLPFPSITILNVDNYTLIQLEENAILHLIHDGWSEYKQDIFLSLIAENKITDDVVPTTYRSAWKIIEKKYIREADITKLQNNSYPFDEDYYQEWGLKNNYKISILKENQIPYDIKYNGILIKSIYDKYADLVNNIYYLAESKKEFILSYLEGVLPDNALNSLKLAKANFQEKKKKKEFEVEYTDEETEALKRLFGDEIPKNFHKDLNIAALISALIYLAKNGFDVTEAENNLKTSHIYSQLSPVYYADKTKNYTVMGRSAKTGLLYLTANAWERLASDDIMLFVSTGKSEQNHHLFNNKQELLNVSDTNFQVFRVDAESSAANTDSILNGSFDNKKIWLIFKMKENSSYNSIFEGSIRTNEDTPDYDNINDSEDSEY